MSLSLHSKHSLGVSSAAANGYSYLPNGILMQWGTVIANTTSTITFPIAFPTSLYSVTISPRSNLYVGANVLYFATTNTTVAQIRSSSTTTSATAYYMAIGV